MINDISKKLNVRLFQWNYKFISILCLGSSLFKKKKKKLKIAKFSTREIGHNMPIREI